MSQPKVSWTCASCRIHYALGSPIAADAPSQLDIGGYGVFKKLRSMAQEFDAASRGERYTAQEFLDYIEPSILGTDRHRATLALTSLPPSMLREPA